MKETGDLQVRLTKKGRNYWGLCPFHSEKTPSFSVSPDKQIFKCFGCGKGGGAINFVMELENLSFRDAVSVLAKRAGMSEVYLHQVFSGKRNPSRSRLICMCIGMQATLEETQELLKLCGCAQLYPKNKRDAIIIFGITHGKDLFEINDTLFEEEEETLY